MSIINYKPNQLARVIVCTHTQNSHRSPKVQRLTHASRCMKSALNLFHLFLPGGTKEIQHTWRSVLFPSLYPTPQWELLTPFCGGIVGYVRVDLCGALTPVILLFQGLELVMKPSLSGMQGVCLRSFYKKIKEFSFYQTGLIYQ